MSGLRLGDQSVSLPDLADAVICSHQTHRIARENREGEQACSVDTRGACDDCWRACVARTVRTHTLRNARVQTFTHADQTGALRLEKSNSLWPRKIARYYVAHKCNVVHNFISLLTQLFGSSQVSPPAPLVAPSPATCTVSLGFLSASQFVSCTRAVA